MSNFYKGLMDELKAEENRAVMEIEDELRRQVSKVLADFANRKQAVQAACPHDRTHTKDIFDYPKREDWTETYCSDCGKMLSRV